MNAGIIGGTFDPVHLAHLAVAEEARARLDMAEVFFVPAGQPWFKTGTGISPAEHRVKMLRLALKGKPYFKVSTIEIDRPGPTYTIDTVIEFKSRQSEGDELFFILGWDSLAGLPRWKEPEKVIGLCRLVTVPRPGYSCPDIKAMEGAVPGLSRRVIFLDKPEMAISATEIRERVRRGQSISRLVPEAVDRYIRRHKLYRG